MLSFETVHALTGCLIAADAGVPPGSWGAPATLLLIQDRPVYAHDPGRRAIRAVPVSLAGAETTARPGGLPGILCQVAAAVSGDTPHTPFPAVDLNLIAAHLTEPVPQLRLLGWRLLGWAVRYNDVHSGLVKLDIGGTSRSETPGQHCRSAPVRNWPGHWARWALRAAWSAAWCSTARSPRSVGPAASTACPRW